jgi:hypothetical protein
MPRIVEMRDANRCGGSDWIGLKQTGASTLVGVEVAPLGLGLGDARAAWRGGGGLGVGGALRLCQLSTEYRILIEEDFLAHVLRDLHGPQGDTLSLPNVQRC